MTERKILLNALRKGDASAFFALCDLRIAEGDEVLEQLISDIMNGFYWPIRSALIRVGYIHRFKKGQSKILDSMQERIYQIVANKRITHAN